MIDLEYFDIYMTMTTIHIGNLESRFSCYPKKLVSSTGEENMNIKEACHHTGGWKVGLPTSVLSEFHFMGKPNMGKLHQTRDRSLNSN